MKQFRAAAIAPKPKTQKSNRNKKAIPPSGTALKPDVWGYRLQGHDVLCLPAFGTSDQIELNGLAFLKRTETVRLDGTVVNKNVLTIAAADEAVTLGIVEPLNCTLFHVAVEFLQLNLGLRWIGELQAGNATPRVPAGLAPFGVEKRSNRLQLL